jgi:predicted GNAT superfamily acetyltransferase
MRSSHCTAIARCRVPRPVPDEAPDTQLALAWREQTRAIFQPAFAVGFTVIDMLYERDVTPRAFYVLTRTESERSIPTG